MVIETEAAIAIHVVLAARLNNRFDDVYVWNSTLSIVYFDVVTFASFQWSYDALKKKTVAVQLTPKEWKKLLNPMLFQNKVASRLCIILRKFNP